MKWALLYRHALFENASLSRRQCHAFGWKLTACGANHRGWISKQLMVGSGSVVSGGRIRAGCAGHNSNGCADCDQGAGAQAGNGTASCCAGGASCRSCCCWHRSSANWCSGLCQCLRRSEQDCRSDQKFFHGISFLVNRGKTL